MKLREMRKRSVLYVLAAFTLGCGLTADGTATGANVIFSTPGKYRLGETNFTAEVKEQGPGKVSYHLARLTSGSNNLISGPTDPVNADGLVLCFDEQGGLWAYHPDHGINFHYLTDGENGSAYLGRNIEAASTGSSKPFLEKMPSSFIERLTEIPQGQ